MNKEAIDPVGIDQSPDPAALRRAQLAALIPEAFSEGQLDVSALKRALGGEALIEGGERYALTWAGKANAYKVLQTPSRATLRPQRDLSVNFDEAQHVFIEGENLEVLKVLQKAYFGKVKLIYIDPPYNTGSDSFIYPDRFQESKEDYLRRINDLSDDGTLMREGFFRKNSKESGHYHSNWLSMMLPRLYIARNLLREDGVIFVSCDDNEVHNLRLVMNEVFGEENFVANVVWQKTYSPANDKKGIDAMHDHLLAYSRSPAIHINLLPRTQKQDDAYTNPDSDFRGVWKAVDASRAEHRDYAVFAVKTPSGAEVWPAKGRSWIFTKDDLPKLIAENRMWFGKNGDSKPSIKRFLTEVQQGVVPTTWWAHEDCGHNDESKKELKALFPEDLPFETPKPTRLIERLLLLTTAPSSNDLIFDFFGGSSTTADAIIRLNQKDNGNRRFVLVQLPEATDREPFPTISAIGRERICRVIAKVQANADLASPLPENLGFKSFLLTPSNFKQWRGDGIDTAEQLAEQMLMFAKSEKEGAAVEHMLYELLLKFSQELTTPVETLDVAGGKVYALHGRKMLFVLESFTDAMIQPLVDMKPREIITIDGVFLDSDPLKSNLDLQCHDAGIKFTCL